MSQDDARDTTARHTLLVAMLIWGLNVPAVKALTHWFEPTLLAVVRMGGRERRSRREAGVRTQAVGMIVDPQQAEEVLATQKADLVALGREALFDPYWAHHAAATMGVDPQYQLWPERHGVWLQKRAPGLARARAQAAQAALDLRAAKEPT